VRIAVLSDIHGNLEAFESVLRDIDCSEIDHIVNLGDSIGYGSDPENVLELIQKRGILNIHGNHEQAILDENFRFFLKDSVLKSINQTLKYLSSTSLLYLRELPRYRVFNDALFVHACPPDSCENYLNFLSFRELETVFKSYKNTISFAGHTHKLMIIRYNGEKISFQQFENHPIKIDKYSRYIFNVGSVGQPRDNDPRAGYVIWDCTSSSIEARRVQYDIESTANKIIERGFEQKDANRLFRNSAKGK
jgi:predicted phosphodiesterase